ncbi:MAG: class I SAM-dependent methyltransferase, partial [Rubrivivax sp.]|nr:class I SAM-dependent methyltransferase [Rubrivivax sp.]
MAGAHHAACSTGRGGVVIAGDLSGYSHKESGLNHSHGYLLPPLFRLLDGLPVPAEKRRLFELGCGNGSVAWEIAKRGWEVWGVDPSQEGIDQARRNYPGLPLYRGSAYDDLAGRYGQYPVVVSLEVVEHVYFPRIFAKTVYSLVEAGGAAVISTPYHGYLKNVALALCGAWDRHFTALWDHGHIKFWSRKTLRTLLEE